MILPRVYPRVEELFEARKPKGAAVITDMDGVVHITENRGRTEIQVVDKETGEAIPSLCPPTGPECM